MCTCGYTNIHNHKINRNISKFKHRWVFWASERKTDQDVADQRGLMCLGLSWRVGLYQGGDKVIADPWGRQNCFLRRPLPPHFVPVWVPRGLIVAIRVTMVEGDHSVCCAWGWVSYIEAERNL